VSVAPVAPDIERVTRPEESTDEGVDLSRPWVAVNLMSYVVYVLQKLFGYNREKATALMLDVHHRGRAVVSAGSREQMEVDVARLHAAGLWATLVQDD